MSYVKFVDVISGRILRKSYINVPAYDNCKRLMVDRRRLSFKSIWHSIFTGRRRVVQRQACDVSGYIIDTHESWLLLFTLGALVLCVVDAFLTIVLLQHGAFEANPFMAYLLEINISLFFWVKFTITFSSLMALLIFKNFTIFKYLNGYYLIVITFSIYMCLIRYEFIMLEQIYI